jgi:hypothetical protein
LAIRGDSFGIVADVLREVQEPYFDAPAPRSVTNTRTLRGAGQSGVNDAAALIDARAASARNRSSRWVMSGVTVLAKSVACA